MQTVLMRPRGAGGGPWFRSTIVDFSENEYMIVLPPLPDDDQSRQNVAGGGGEGGEDAEQEIPAQPAGGPGAGRPSPRAAQEIAAIFRVGTPLEVEINFPDGVRRFGSVVRRLDTRFGGSLQLPWPTEGTRIQRRDFVRVDIGYPITVHFRLPGQDFRKLSGHTMDLSAGGVRLRLPESIPNGTTIELEIGVDTFVGQTLPGRVVRWGELRRRRGVDYWVAVEFAVDEALRKQLTQLVFEVERERLRKAEQ